MSKIIIPAKGFLSVIGKLSLPFFIIFSFFAFSSVSNASTLLDQSVLSSAYSSRISTVGTAVAHVYVDTNKVSTISGFDIVLAGSGNTTLQVNIFCIDIGISTTSIATTTVTYNVSASTYNWQKTFLTPLNVSTCDYIDITLTGGAANSGVCYGDAYSYSISKIHSIVYPNNQLFAFVKNSSSTDVIYGHQPVDFILYGSEDSLTCSDYGDCISPSECEDCEECTDCNEIGYACQDYYSNDLNIITSCAETYASGTAVVEDVEYRYYHIPAIVWALFIPLLIFFFGRLMLEIIIKLRK